jgi:hypothetical protein
MTDKYLNKIWRRRQLKMMLLFPVIIPVLAAGFIICSLIELIWFFTKVFDWFYDFLGNIIYDFLDFVSKPVNRYIMLKKKIIAVNEKKGWKK